MTDQTALPFLYTGSEIDPSTATREVAAACEFSQAAKKFVEQYRTDFDAAYEKAVKQHQQHLEKMHGMIPEIGGASAAVEELNAMIVATQKELDAADIRVTEIPEIDSLKMQVRIQNWLGIGLDHAEMLSKIGDDARLLAAYREILQFRDNHRDARDVSDKITELLAPGAKESLLKLKEAKRNLIDYEQRYLYRWNHAVDGLSWSR